MTNTDDHFPVLVTQIYDGEIAWHVQLVSYDFITTGENIGQALTSMVETIKSEIAMYVFKVMMSGGNADQFELPMAPIEVYDGFMKARRLGQTIIVHWTDNSSFEVGVLHPEDWANISEMLGGAKDV